MSEEKKIEMAIEERERERERRSRPPWSRQASSAVPTSPSTGGLKYSRRSGFLVFLASRRREREERTVQMAWKGPRRIVASRLGSPPCPVLGASGTRDPGGACCATSLTPGEIQHGNEEG